MPETLLVERFDHVVRLTLEELYQEAWTEALEMQARGQEINDVGARLRTIAWRRGRDRLRNLSATALDPTSYALVNQPDSHALSDETVQVEVDAALIWQVVDSLDERQAAVIKMRFGQHMTSREISPNSACLPSGSRRS